MKNFVLFYVEDERGALRPVPIEGFYSNVREAKLRLSRFDGDRHIISLCLVLAFHIALYALWGPTSPCSGDELTGKGKTCPIGIATGLVMKRVKIYTRHGPRHVKLPMPFAFAIQDGCGLGHRSRNGPFDGTAAMLALARHNARVAARQEASADAGPLDFDLSRDINRQVAGTIARVFGVGMAARLLVAWRAELAALAQRCRRARVAQPPAIAQALHWVGGALRKLDEAAAAPHTAGGTTFWLTALWTDIENDMKFACLWVVLARSDVARLV